MILHPYGVNHGLTKCVDVVNRPPLLGIQNVLRKLIDRFLFGGYEAANRASEKRVVSRYARGNTSIQFGRYLNKPKLEKLLSDGDRAAQRLAKRAKRAGV